MKSKYCFSVLFVKVQGCADRFSNLFNWHDCCRHTVHACKPPPPLPLRSRSTLLQFCCRCRSKLDSPHARTAAFYPVTSAHASDLTSSSCPKKLSVCPAAATLLSSRLRCCDALLLECSSCYSKHPTWTVSFKSTEITHTSPLSSTTSAPVTSHWTATSRRTDSLPKPRTMHKIEPSFRFKHFFHSRFALRYWGFKRVIDVITGDADLRMLNLGVYYDAWQAARRTQSGELIGRMQIM